MSETARGPRVYDRGPWSRFVEGLRYGGGVGQWSWLIHRVTGLGIMLYLVAHITDTFFVVVNPAWYDHAMNLYAGVVNADPDDYQYFWQIRWAFRIGELGLIACVLFHSLNGLRVVLFDFWPRAAHHQKGLFRAVVVLFWFIMVPVAIWVVLPLAHPPDTHASTPRGSGGAHPTPLD